MPAKACGDMNKPSNGQRVIQVNPSMSRRNSMCEGDFRSLSTSKSGLNNSQCSITEIYSSPSTPCTPRISRANLL